jgi:hypothetical protein
MADYENMLRDIATGEPRRGSAPTEKIPLLEVGRSADSGVVYFEATKTARVEFSAPFTRPPRVSVTPCDSSGVPVYRTSVTPTGMVIRFKQAWTGEVEWLAIERNGGQ